MFFYKFNFPTFFFCVCFLINVHNCFATEFTVYESDKSSVIFQIAECSLNASATFVLVDTFIEAQDNGTITYPYRNEESEWPYDESFYVPGHPLGYCAKINTEKNVFELSWIKFIVVCQNAMQDDKIKDCAAKSILRENINKSNNSLKEKLSTFFLIHPILYNLYKYPETNVEELSEEEENVCSSAEIISAHTPAKLMTVKREVYEQTINERNALLQLKKDQEIYKKQLIEKENAINLCNDQIKELQKNIEKLQSEIEKILSAKAEDKKIIKDLNLAKEKLEVQLKEAETQKEEKEKLLQQELEHKNTLIQKKETDLQFVEKQFKSKNEEYTTLTQKLKEKNASYAPYYWACLVFILWLIRDHKFFLSYIY